MHLKIWHKGLILISVPLLFEVFFVIGLTSLWQHAQEEAAALAQSKAVVAHTSELGLVLFKSGYLLISWKEVHSGRLIKEYEQLIAQVPALCSQLNELTQHSPRQRIHMLRIIDAANKIVQLTANFSRPSDSPMLKLMSLQTYHDQAELAYRTLMQESAALDQDEEQAQIGDSDAERRIREQINLAIEIGIAFNIILSALLAVFFSKSITTRLNVLMENARRFAAGDALKHPVTGNDEIATLDRVFHGMAEQLSQTAMRKQEFVSMITHDLRTPLTSMTTVLSTLTENAEERHDEADQKRLGIVQRSVDSLIKLVNDLLDIDRLESGHLPLEIEHINVRECMDRAVDSVRYYAQQHEVKLVVTATDVALDADARRLEQVMVNLLSNAIKFSTKGNAVSLDAKSDTESLTISVKDEGRGIPSAYLDQVFDRFSQVEAQDSVIKGGSGLGLAICKALIELHHGTIGVESIEGQGSRFWFRIPLQQQNIQSKAK
jgi:signal transduction histidine kinase